MNPCQFTSAIHALACAISRAVPAQQLPLLAAFFTQLGDTLTTLSLLEGETAKNSEPYQVQQKSPSQTKL
ncbi:MAG: hypothetical protein PHS97_07345 [Oscillospiraceae bacterium]|nr:hypothetical protein [Oscillospiraceae bacterium]